MKIIFLHSFSELCFLIFFFLSGGSDFRIWNFHFHKTKAWGGKQVDFTSEACVYHGREAGADPWTKTKQSIFSW
jgi:hypothetical protein